MDITLESVFLKLVNMSIAASWLILVVILLRFLLKNMPKSIRCILWGFVAIRLLCPFSFKSALSLIPSTETLPREFLYAAAPQVNTGIPALNSAINPVVAESLAPAELTSVNPTQILSFIFACIWIIGMVVMVLYAVFSYFRIRRKVQVSIEISSNLYLCDYIDTPFILGIINPKIYLPSSMEQQNIDHVLAHEQAHLARRDHWWKPLGFLLLTVYWFNPLMWIAYILLCRDIELACDEKVVSTLSNEDKKAYSSALLSCSVSRHIIAACPLAFGELGVKNRIKSVLNYKKPAFWAIIIAVIVCIAVAVCFLTDPVEDQNEIAWDPFASVYYFVDEIIYDTSGPFTVETAPIYHLESDRSLNIWEDKSSDNWLHPGEFKEIHLTEDNFDLAFESGFEDAARIRINNIGAFKLSVNGGTRPVIYYLLVQRNGELYLTYGNLSDNEAQYTILQMFSLTNTDILRLDRLAGGNYVTGECIYFHPASSAHPSGQGDYNFTVTGDGIVLCQGKFGELFSVSDLNWGWTDECPLSSEQLLAFYEFHDILSEEDPILDSGCRYQVLNEEYFLVERNGSIYLVNWRPKSGDALGYIWSIFEVVSVSGDVAASSDEVTGKIVDEENVRIRRDLGQLEERIQPTEVPMITSRPELAFPGLSPYQSIISEEIYEVTRDGAFLEYRTTYTSPTIMLEIGLISTDDGTEYSNEARDGSAQGVIEDIPIGNYQLYVKNIGCINDYEPVNVEGGAVVCDLVGGEEVKEILQPGQTLHDLTTGDLQFPVSEAEQYVFWTNSTKIAVTVESEQDFNGTVYLGITDVPGESFLQFPANTADRTCTFSHLTAAIYYTLSFENLDGCIVTVSEDPYPSWVPDWLKW